MSGNSRWGTATAIETPYRGFRFRSRLEARWAVFYDAIGEPFEYEPEGFKLTKGGYYLPDFYMPRLDCFIEIKPTKPTDEEISRVFTLGVDTGKSVYLFFGPVDQVKTYPPDRDRDQESAYTAGDWAHAWCRCPLCGQIGIEFECRAGRLCKCGWSKKSSSDDDRYLHHATDIAQGFRFERGGDTPPSRVTPEYSPLAEVRNFLKWRTDEPVPERLRVACGEVER